MGCVPSFSMVKLLKIIEYLLGIFFSHHFSEFRNHVIQFFLQFSVVFVNLQLLDQVSLLLQENSFSILADFFCLPNLLETPLFYLLELLKPSLTLLWKGFSIVETVLEIVFRIKNFYKYFLSLSTFEIEYFLTFFRLLFELHVKIHLQGKMVRIDTLTLLGQV